LAETMVAIGAEHDTPVVAVMTNMDVPLGRAVGNWPEIRESIACLRGEHADTPLMQIIRALAGEMIALGGKADTPREGRAQARAAIEDGAALDRFRRLVEAQGGDLTYVDDPEARPNSAPVATVQVPGNASSYVADLDALAIGRAAVELGAGRQTKDDTVDPMAGLTELKKPGDAVGPGDTLAQLHASGTPDLDSVRTIVQNAYTFADTPPDPSPVLHARYSADGWVDL
ncbi:MAG: thymidine phosphorylase, partial [Candidatus Bipolaricaulia bacterium]